MLRLCGKKLLSFLCNAILYFIVYFLSSLTWFNLIRLILPNEIAQYVVLMVVPLLIVLLFVYRRRARNRELKRNYVAARREDPVRNTPWRALLHSEDFHAELITFGSLVLIVCVLYSLIGSDAPWYVDLLPTTILFTEAMTVFAVLDGLNRLAVYRRWQRDMI